MSNLADTSLHVSVADFLFHIFCGILGAGGCFFFGGVTLFIIAPIIFEGFGWEGLLVCVFLVPLFLVSLCGFFLFLYWVIGDLVKGKIAVHGPVTSKREGDDIEDGSHYYIQVREREFSVERLFYSQVSEGEEVVVIFWPCSEIVIEARKLTEDTAHPLLI